MQFFTLLTHLAAAASVYAVTVTPIAAAGNSTGTVVVVAPSSTAVVPVSAVTAASISTYVVSSFTTVCATPGTFYYADVCYTATSASQTVTITNCPCTLTTTLAAATSYAAATTTTPPPVYVTAGANNVAAHAGGVMGALAMGAAAFVL